MLIMQIMTLISITFHGKVNEFSSVTLIGCGTAYHSCLMAKYWFEAINLIRCKCRYCI